MGFLGNFFKSDVKNSGSSATTTTVNVPQWYKDYLADNIKDIKGYTDANKALTADQAIVDFTDDEMAAFARAREGTGKYDPILDESLSTLQQVQQRAFEGINPDDIQKFMNPYQQNVLDTTKAEMVRDADIAREQVNASAANAGAFGGSRHGIVEAELNRDLSQNLQNVQYQGMADAYQSALEASRYSDSQVASTAGQIGNLANAAQGIAANDTSQLAQVGQSLRDMEQGRTDFTYNNPLNQSLQFQNALNSVNTSVYGTTQSGNTTQTAHGQGKGWGSQLLGAGLAIAGFSDERIKENKKRVGETDDGLPIYTYNYKGTPQTQMGVMAQDVEKVNPDAVSETEDGIKKVDYDKIGEEEAQNFFDGGGVLSSFTKMADPLSMMLDGRTAEYGGAQGLPTGAEGFGQALQDFVNSQKLENEAEKEAEDNTPENAIAEDTPKAPAVPVQVPVEDAEVEDKSTLAKMLDKINDNKDTIAKAGALMFEDGGAVAVEAPDMFTSMYRKVNNKYAKPAFRSIKDFAGDAYDFVDDLYETDSEKLQRLNKDSYRMLGVDSVEGEDWSPEEGGTASILEKAVLKEDAIKQGTGMPSVLEQTLNPRKGSTSMKVEDMPTTMGDRVRMPDMIPNPSARAGESLGKAEPTWREKMKKKSRELASDPMFNFGLALMGSDKPFFEAVSEAGQSVMDLERAEMKKETEALAAKQKAEAEAIQQNIENKRENRKLDINERRADAYEQSIQADAAYKNHLIKNPKATMDPEHKLASKAGSDAVNSYIGMTGESDPATLDKIYTEAYNRAKNSSNNLTGGQTIVDFDSL